MLIRIFSRAYASDRCGSIRMVVVRKTATFRRLKRQTRKIAGRVLLLVGSVGADNFRSSPLDR